MCAFLRRGYARFTQPGSFPQSDAEFASKLQAEDDASTPRFGTGARLLSSPATLFLVESCVLKNPPGPPPRAALAASEYEGGGGFPFWWGSISLCDGAGFSRFKSSEKGRAFFLGPRVYAQRHQDWNWRDEGEDFVPSLFETSNRQAVDTATLDANTARRTQTPRRARVSRAREREICWHPL